MAGTLKAQWGKHSVRNDLLGGSRNILESAGVFYMTAGVGIPGATHKKREEASVEKMAQTTLLAEVDHFKSCLVCFWIAVRKKKQIKIFVDVIGDFNQCDMKSKKTLL